MKILLTTFLAWTVANGPSAILAAEGKPNIVFIFADDLGIGDVNCA